MATTALVKNLADRGVKIHLVSIVPENEFPCDSPATEEERTRAMSTLGVSEVTLVTRPSSSLLRLVSSAILRPWTPVTLAAYATRSVRSEISKITRQGHPDLVVYDGLHAAAGTISSLPRSNDSVPLCAQAYRAHNVESSLWFRAAGHSKNPAKKLLLSWQGILVRAAEKRLSRRSSYLFPVSSVDELHFKTYLPSGVVRTLPIGVRVDSPGSEAPRGRNVLFIGKLDWSPNREGLEWILKNVWPHAYARAPDLTLKIVGSGKSTWLEAYRRLPGVEILGHVESVAPHYRDSLVSIVPIFYGSGTRVKAIESSLHGRACISTAIGVEGTGLVRDETYIHAETSEEWIDALVSLNIGGALRLGEEARAHANHTFDPGRIADQFIETVLPLLSRSEPLMHEAID